MVFSNFFFAGRNLAGGLWRKASSLCRRAISGFKWLKENFSDLVKKALKFLSRLEVITFAVTLGVLLGLGFTADGIAAHSVAAAFQSAAYAAFTPADGLFAGLTSMAMMGVYPFFAVGLAGIVGVAVMVITKTGKGQAQTQ